MKSIGNDIEHKTFNVKITHHCNKIVFIHVVEVKIFNYIQNLIIKYWFFLIFLRASYINLNFNHKNKRNRTAVMGDFDIKCFMLNVIANMDFVVVWFQKRKHGGDEDLIDVHKHKKK